MKKQENKEVKMFPDFPEVEFRIIKSKTKLFSPNHIEAEEEGEENKAVGTKCLELFLR